VTLNPGTRREIGVRLAAAERAGAGRFTFRHGTSTGTLIINAGGSEQADDVSSVQVLSRRAVDVIVRSGRFCEQPVGYTLHVALRFDRPFASHALWNRESYLAGAHSTTSHAIVPLGYTPGLQAPSLPFSPSGTAQAGAILRFATAKHHSVGLRVGLSYVSEHGAVQALHREIGSRAVGQVGRRAAREWATLLGRVQVAGGSAADRRMLATTLYQSLLSPQIVGDVDGRYPGIDGKVHRARGWTAYSQMSLWDEYRTHAQLLSLVAPGRATDIARSLLADEREAGILPRWPVVGGSPDIMVGDPAVPYLADFRAFGVRGFSVSAAIAAGVRGARSNGVDDETPGAIAAAGDPELLGGGYYAERPGNPAYLTLHYVPTELDTTTNTTGGVAFVLSPDIVWGSASTSLEYATADFALARMAAASCRRGVAKTFFGRAAWWHDSFDPNNGYVEPRSVTGAFLPVGQTGVAHGFVEGDASQYTFMVPFDVAGLRRALGGPRALVRRLDLLFDQLNAGPQSAHAFLGNEPQLDTPYEYLWAGRPDRTESVMHRALRSLYAPDPDGYPGNVDGGTMSSWWVFNALGLYPLIPGDDVMSIGAPLFRSVVVHLPGGRLLLIETPGAGAAHPYVRGARLNGRALRRAWVRYSDLRRGATIRVTAAARPGRWAQSLRAAPPSYAASARLPCGRPRS
jgi:predicted alpha-1,2-mannosidase